MPNRSRQRSDELEFHIERRRGTYPEADAAIEFSDEEIQWNREDIQQASSQRESGTYFERRRGRSRRNLSGRDLQGSEDTNNGRQIRFVEDSASEDADVNELEEEVQTTSRRRAGRSRLRTPGIADRIASARRHYPEGEEELNRIRNIWNIASTLLIGGIVVFLLINALILQNPKNVFVRTQQKFLTESLASLGKWMGEGIEGDTISKKFTLSAATTVEEINQYLDTSEIMFAIDNRKKMDLMNFRLKYYNMDLVEMIGTYENGILGIQTGSKMDDAYYTADINTFFSALSGQEIDIASYLNKKVSAAQKKKLLGEYGKILFSVANDKNISVKRVSDFELDQIGDKFSGKQYMVKPTGKDMEKMLIRLAEKLESDDLLADVLRTSGFDLDLLTWGSYFGMQGKAELLPKDSKSMLEYIASMIKANASTLASEMEVAGLTWEIGVDKNRIRYIHLSYQSGESQKTIYGFEHKGMSNAGSSMFFILDERNAKQSTLLHSFSEEKERSKGILTLTTDLWGAEVEYDVDRSKKWTFLPYGKYDFNTTLTSATANLTINPISDERTDYELMLDNLDADGGKMSRIVVRMEEENGIQLLTPDGSPKDMAKMSDEEIQRALEGMSYYMTNNLEKIFAGGFVE